MVCECVSVCVSVYVSVCECVPTWRREIGNFGCASVVIQTLHDSCMLSVCISVSWSSFMKSRPRWQFCSSSQPPCGCGTSLFAPPTSPGVLTAVMHCCSSLLACTSCPWPMERALHPNLSFLDKASMLLVGSAPIDRKHMRGVVLSLSSHILSRSSITPSAYFSPAVSAMYFLA